MVKAVSNSATAAGTCSDFNKALAESIRNEARSGRSRTASAWYDTFCVVLAG
jgi:hypothetical protein